MRPRSSTRPRLALVALALAGLAACSNGDSTAPTSPAPTTRPATTAAPTTAAPTTVATTAAATTAAPTTAAPSTTAAPTTAPATTSAGASSPATAYLQPGPYPVGVVELDNGGSPMTVWYPAQPGSEAGKPKATYDMRNLVPAAVKDKIPAAPDLVVTMDAYESLPGAATGGPFPLVLFSHGLAGFRTQSSFLTQHLASWGFVVASPEHPSRDLVALLDGTFGQPGRRSDVDDLTAALDTMQQATKAAGSPLDGLVDFTKIAATGHSAGGTAAYKLAGSDDRIDTYVAMSSPGAGPSGGQVPSTPNKPSLFITGAADAIAPLAAVEKGWQSAASPKRLAVLDNVTHLGPSDICSIAADRGGVLKVAQDAGVTVNPIVVRLFGDACDPKFAKPADAWGAIDHLVVAQLRSVFGIDPKPVGLGPELATAYPVKITYQEG